MKMWTASISAVIALALGSLAPVRPAQPTQVGTVNLRDGSVTSAKLADGAVTAAKVGSTPLSALAGVTGAANVVPYFTASNAAATTAFPAFGRALVGESDAVSARAALGVPRGKAANVVVDYAADDTGTADSTAAIQNALAAAADHAGGVRGVYLPANKAPFFLYKVTPGTLNAFQSCQGGFLVGDGGYTTTDLTSFYGSMLLSDGSNAGRPVLNMDDCAGILLADFAVWGNSSPSLVGAADGVRWQNRAAGGTPAGGSRLERVTTVWCNIGLDVGSVDGGDVVHDTNNCDNLSLEQCTFADENTGIRLNQDQNVENVLSQCSFTSVPVAIDAEKGGCLEAVGTSCFNVGTLLVVGAGGLRDNFKFDRVGLDNDGTVRPKLYAAAGGTECQAVFDTAAANPSWIPDYNSPGSGVSNGGACVTVRAGHHVEVRNSKWLGAKNGNPIVRFEGGGYVVLSGCKIPANHDYVRDPTGSGGTLRVINCIDEATGNPIDDWGDLSPMVTSVGLSLPGEFTVSGSPVTGSGALSASWGPESANAVLSGPATGAAAPPTFRALVAADIPTVSASKIGSGTLALAQGGTNADLSATGGASQVLKQLSGGAAVTVGQLAASDLSNGTTGSGAAVLASAPTLTTPTLGAASATTINKVAVTAPASGSTLTIDDGFTLHATGNVTALSGSHTGASSGTNTGDQTITLGGAVAGSGTGAITTTLAGYTLYQVAVTETSTAATASTASAYLTLSVTANKAYSVEYHFIFAGDGSGNSATDDASYLFNVAAGTMQMFGELQTLGTALTVQNVALNATGAASTAAQPVGLQGGAGNVTGVRGVCEFTPSSTTTFAVKFGCNATGGPTVNLMKGSYMLVQQLN